MKPIYVPSGAAKEYGDYAINIYTGCPHRCYYCFAPSVLRKDREAFHSNVKPRVNIVDEVRKQLESGDYTGKTVHLCFTCDPYPIGIDHTPTTEIIRLLKAHGAHVQILTKNTKKAVLDINLLDSEDWFGTTITGATTAQEPNANSARDRLFGIAIARNRGVKTWVSFEPVINAEYVLATIAAHGEIMDRIKIGKLNYHPSSIDWADFGRRAETLCQKRGFNYTIKDGLRKEMEGHT